MRRGLTMLELLLALGLLAAVMATVAAWIRIVGAASARLSGPVRWETAAWTALQLVADDLLVHDISARDREPLCEIEEGDLLVRTRLACTREPSGMIRHRYDLDATAGVLRVQERTDAGAVRTRPLLRGVAEWSCAIDDQTRILTVRLVDREGRAVGRRYRLP